MIYYLESYLYLFTCFLPFLYGIKRFKLLDRASRTFSLIATISFIAEIVALYAAVKYHNNLPVYNVSQLLTVVLVCLYFNDAIDSFKKYYVGIVLAAISTLVWSFTIFFVHSIITMNSTFMAYEGIVTIGMAVFSMENLVSKRSHSLFKLKYSHHFWFAWMLLIYWCCSIVQWILYKYFTKEVDQSQYLDLSLTIISMLINIGFALIFFYYPKMKQKNAT